MKIINSKMRDYTAGFLSINLGQLDKEGVERWAQMWFGMSFKDAWALVESFLRNDGSVNFDEKLN